MSDIWSLNKGALTKQILPDKCTVALHKLYKLFDKNMKFTFNVLRRIRNLKLLGFVASKYFHIMTHKVRANSGTHNKQTFNFFTWQV